MYRRLVLLSMALSIILASISKGDLLLHLDGSVTGFGESTAAFIDSAKGNNALPKDNTGASGLGLASSTTQVSSAAIGDTAMRFIVSSKCGSANIADGNPDFDRSYTNFTVSLWYKPDTDNDGATDTDNNLLIGKMGNSGQRGWQLYRFDDSSRISLLYFDGPAGSSQSLSTDLTMPGPTANDFTLISATFSANNAIRLYIDGVQVTAMTSGVKASLNGSNDKPLQVGNRGDSSSDSAGGIIDDLGLWDETLSSQEIAAIHALGIFESLDLQAQEIDNLLNAFNEQSYTLINGHSWHYISGLEHVVGTTGGSSAGNDAYVVLDGEGNGMMIPEPASMGLLLIGSLVALRRRVLN
jgi:hypothetical protein